MVGVSDKFGTNWRRGNTLFRLGNIKKHQCKLCLRHHWWFYFRAIGFWSPEPYLAKEIMLLVVLDSKGHTTLKYLIVLLSFYILRSKGWILMEGIGPPTKLDCWTVIKPICFHREPIPSSIILVLSSYPFNHRPTYPIPIFSGGQ